MINELKKTYELLPKQPGETERYLTVNERAHDGYEIRLEIYLVDKPRLGAAYTVTYDELKSVKFDYEDYAINTLCAILKSRLEEGENNV